MTVSTMKVNPKPIDYSVEMVFAGSLILFIGSFGLVSQILSPMTLIGSISYITGGSLLVISNSPSTKLRLYNSLPSVVKHLMFEKSLLELFQDKSRYVQLLAFLVACLSLPEEKIQELQLGMPGTFDHCRQKGLLTTISTDHNASCSSMALKELASYESSNYYKIPVPMKSLPVSVTQQYRREQSLDPFTQRVVKQTITCLKEKAFSTITNYCHQEVCSVTKTLTQTAVNWIPTVALVSSSTACYYWMMTLMRGKNQYEHYLLNYFSNLASLVLKATKTTTVQVITSYDTSAMLGSLGAAVLSAGAVVAMTSTNKGVPPIPPTSTAMIPLLQLTAVPIKQNKSNNNDHNTINCTNIKVTETKATASIDECADPRRVVLDCILALMRSSEVFLPARPVTEDLIQAKSRWNHSAHANTNLPQLSNTNSNNSNTYHKDWIQAYRFSLLLAYIVAYKLKCGQPQQWKWIAIIYWKQFFLQYPAMES